MATGTILWHGNFKINTEKRGLNFKFHMAEKTEAEARTGAEAIAARYKHLLPLDASIFFATLQKDDTKKDSRFLDGAVGDGSHVEPEPAEPPSVYDFPTTSILVRFEHADGASVTRKIGPVPDYVVADGSIVSSISNVTTFPVAAPAAFVAGDSYAVTFNALMKELLFYTHYVKSGHAPGGEYTYFPWTKAFVLRVGQKKGGRVFV